MNILYIFPHPDDESFGPVAAMHEQLKIGHKIFLLTLTKGGATKQRHQLGLSVEEMGEVRFKEMLRVEQTIGLTSMKVMDYEDSGLAELDPRVLENAVAEHIREIKPEIIVTYPVHGVSGFHDHLVTHAIVKRVYLELKDAGEDYLRRLAFLTLPDKDKPPFMEDGTFRMKNSPKELIDCIMPLNEDNIEAMKAALACYVTYQDTIAQSNVVEKIGERLYFEFYMEDFDPPVKSITEGI